MSLLESTLTTESVAVHLTARIQTDIEQMNFKQLLQLDAIDVCQIDSCRTGGVQEILAILLMSAKAGVMVCPHSGGVVSDLTSYSNRQR